MSPADPILLDVVPFTTPPRITTSPALVALLAPLEISIDPPVWTESPTDNVRFPDVSAIADPVDTWTPPELALEALTTTTSPLAAAIEPAPLRKRIGAPTPAVLDPLPMVMEPPTLPLLPNTVTEPPLPDEPDPPETITEPPSTAAALPSTCTLPPDCSNDAPDRMVTDPDAPSWLGPLPISMLPLLPLVHDPWLEMFTIPD
jgi:hypothetical protein